jgi:hypothetical protein
MKKIVLITFYKDVNLLKKACYSVDNQTIKLDQKYILLDGGGDDIEDADFHDWIILRSSDNVGQFGLFYLFKNHYDADRIFILDSDDIWKPNHVDEHLKVNADIVYSRNRIIKDGLVGRKGGLLPIKNKELNSLYYNNWIGPISQVSFSGDVFSNALPLTESLLTNKDWYFYISILSKKDTSIIFIDKVTLLYRLWDGGVSSNFNKVDSGRTEFWKLLPKGLDDSKLKLSYYKFLLTRKLIHNISFTKIFHTLKITDFFIFTLMFLYSKLFKL